MQQLPIHIVREEIVRLVRKNQVVILEGATGSGKTTHLPVFLYEAGFAENRMIGITEPRKIAAISVSNYVSDLLGPVHRQRVGHQVRFDQNVTSHTKVKFMTDGILLREIQIDPLLSKYAVIVVDEAHERSANIDFILGLLLELLPKRPDLKVVVASATIDTKKFSAYFSGAPIVSIPGTMFPVEVVKTPAVGFGEDMVQAACNVVSSILDRTTSGDILVFLTGQDEIDRAVGFMDDGDPGVRVLGCYGSMAPEDQERIFRQYPGARKVIFATNIAETSITIDGVIHVVDSGLIKQSNFHPETGISSLDVVEHSVAGCNQRKGRAGRTQAGFYYPLYRTDGTSTRPAYTEPEIRRMSLAGVVLAMEMLGIEDIMNFRFVDTPDREAFIEAYNTLIALGAIDRQTRRITKLGERMAALPLEPRLARMLIEAETHNCVRNVGTIAAFMTAGNPFVRPKGKEFEADAHHAEFKNSSSDFLTFLTVWSRYVASGFSNSWCRTKFLNAKVLQEVRSIRDQLFKILEANGIKISAQADEDTVSKCVASGLLYNLFELGSRREYLGVVRKDSIGLALEVFIHPGSVVFERSPVFMVAFTTRRTTKLFAQFAMEVCPEWLPELMPSVFSSFCRVTSVDFGTNEATVGDVLFKNGEHRFEYDVREVSLEKAEGIQNAAIEFARSKGWERLTCREDFLSLKPFVESTARTYSTVSPGRRYYCVKAKGLGSIGDWVKVAFEVFNFEPQSKPVSGLNAAARSVVEGGNTSRPASADDLADLAKMFAKK